jgi:hypothetical protein
VLHTSVDALLNELGNQIVRVPMDKHSDSLSGSPFERVEVSGAGAGAGTAAGAGQRYVLKHISRDLDWLMRCLGDGVDGAPPWALIAWQHGLLDRLPPAVDHTIHSVAYDGRVLSLLMRDVGTTLVPAGTGPVPLEQHRRFLDHMAAMHAEFFGFVDSYRLMPLGNRYTGLTPAAGEREIAAGTVDAVPRMLPAGWASLRAAAPDAYEVAHALATDPGPLVTALRETPDTFIHGDWKFGNLGSHPDGRTVLLDWGWPGQAGPCVDLAWYLAVNCDRLPESKEDSAAAYRDRLEHHGIDTSGWWPRQLELALVGGFCQLGWSKTGDPAELGWWTERIVPVARDLLR